MKTYIVILFILLSSCQISKARQIIDNKSADSDNIYHTSIQIYCEYLKSVDFKSQKIYVEQNYLITKDLPEKILGIDIEVINSEQLKKILKTHEYIQVIRIIPLRLKEGDFFVNIIPFKVSYRKRNFNFINEGGTKIIFQYDCSSNNLIFSEIKNFGI
jgi:hypothetical protein